MRITHKRKDRGPNSLDLCPYCISYGCDPMSMSPLFRHKVDERMRKQCCPSCGKPKEFCSCKSHLDTPAVMNTHNNKKLRQAKEMVQQRERAYQEWTSYKNALLQHISPEVYQEVHFSLKHHQVPDFPLHPFLQIAGEIGMNQDILAVGWLERK